MTLLRLERDPETPRGVSFCKREQRYQSRITHEGVNKSLGYYETLEEAIAAYNGAKKLSKKLKEISYVNKSVVWLYLQDLREEIGFDSLEATALKVAQRIIQGEKFNV